jgi:hypothetical protein
MFESVAEVERSLSEVVRRLEPGVLHAGDAARLVERFAAIEKLAAAALTLLAPRAADAGGWRGSERSAAHWLARTTGTSVGAAVGMLEAGQQLEKLPVAREALRSGELSVTQVAEIASAAAVAPAAEAELVAAAGVEPVAGLRERCRKVKAAALCDEAARYRAVHASRALRHWCDPDGAFRLDLRTTPDAGAEVLAALEARRRRLFDAARNEGRRERPEAYLADALVVLARDAEGGDTGRVGPKATVQVRVDHSAFVRGHTVAGETCEVAGVGPVPVATVRALAADAILSAVVTKGVEVTAVAHLGRTIPAHLRTALEARDPTCVVEGCGVRQHLEIDHVVPFATGGPTSLDNLARLCRWHHHLKTYAGYRLEGGPGHWRWLAPDGSPPGPAPPPAVDPRDERADHLERADRRPTLRDLKLALAQLGG